MADFPITPEALTIAWLSEALGFPVQDFEVTRFAEGTGIIAMVTRVLLTTEPGNPVSVIARSPTPNATNPSIAGTYSMYAREVMFYQGIAGKVEIRAPLLLRGQRPRHGADYDLARCRERYRVCALYLLCFAVSIAGQLDPENERGQALGRVLPGNAMSAPDEMNAFALLR